MAPYSFARSAPELYCTILPSFFPQLYEIACQRIFDDASAAHPILTQLRGWSEYDYKKGGLRE